MGANRHEVITRRPIIMVGKTDRVSFVNSRIVRHESFLACLLKLASEQLKDCRDGRISESQSDGTVRMRDSMPAQTDGETRTAASLQHTISSTLYK